MALAIDWRSASGGVGAENLQKTALGPFQRGVSGVFPAGSPYGQWYNNVQEAWDAAAPGDEIVVLPGVYSGGLDAGPASGPQKDHITIRGLGVWNWGAAGDSVRLGKLFLEGCHGIRLVNLTVENAAADAVKLTGCNGLRLEWIYSSIATAKGFLVDGCDDLNLYQCLAAGCGSNGFYLYGGCERVLLDHCWATANGSHGFQLATKLTGGVNTHAVLRHCRAFNQSGSGSGFDIAMGATAGSPWGWDNVELDGCEAYSNAAHGFNLIQNTAALLSVGGRCIARNNTSSGFRTSGAGGVALWNFGNYTSSGNGSNYTSFPASGLVGYSANGLTAPGTNT